MQNLLTVIMTHAGFIEDPNLGLPAYLGTHCDKFHDFFHNAAVTFYQDQHMDSMLECSEKWNQARLSWKVGKNDLWQWTDPKLRFKGLFQMKNVISTFPERLNFCRFETHADKMRLHQFKTAFLDEVLLGNIWTHIEPLKEAVKLTREAYNEHNYVKAG